MENLFSNPELEQVSWKISAGWAKQKINCCLDGILNECGGCCKGKKGWTAINVYPMRAFGDKGICEHFIEGKGCKWNVDERPVLCLLYPFYLLGDTFVIYHRVLGASCKKAFKTQDKTIFEHFESTWTSLFGKEQYDRVYDEIFNKRLAKGTFYPSEDLLKVYNAELYRYEANTVPESRVELLKKVVSTGSEYALTQAEKYAKGYCETCGAPSWDFQRKESICNRCDGYLFYSQDD